MSKTQRRSPKRFSVRRAAVAMVTTLAIPATATLAGTSISAPAQAATADVPIANNPDTKNIACAWSASVGSAWSNPYVLYGHTVAGTGVLVSSPKVFCGKIEWKVYSKTKVCGFWGCNWHTKGQASGGNPNSTWYERHTAQNCRSGTHSYQQIGAWTRVTEWPGYPTTSWYGSNVRKLTC